MLVMVSSLLTLFIGVFQILAEPLILSIADARTMGIAETICASGMLLSSLYLGIRGIKDGYVIAYGCSGILADGIAKYGGISVGRGAGMVIAFSGVALVIVSVSILFMKEIRILEEKTGGEERC